jgi:hypothetical protein
MRLSSTPDEDQIQGQIAAESEVHTNILTSAQLNSKGPSKDLREPAKNCHAHSLDANGGSKM